MQIPEIVLNNGVKIPMIGNGPATPGYTPQYCPKRSFIQRAYNKLVHRPLIRSQWVDAVAHSFQIGFTLLDNSASYQNEELVYKAICKSGVKREDLFITTRASNKAQYAKKIRDEFFDSLKKLHTDYVDLYQFHWPVTDCYIDTWNEMVKLYKEGYCRSIGIANCHPHHITNILKCSDVTPMINQVEIHPLFTQKNLIKFCKDRNIVVEAYTAIARFDDRLMHLPILKKIGDKYHKSIPQVILRWHIQNGVIPIIRSLNKKRQKENISVFDFELTEDELRIIDSININSRLRYDPDNCDFTIL